MGTRRPHLSFGKKLHQHHQSSSNFTPESLKTEQWEVLPMVPSGEGNYTASIGYLDWLYANKFIVMQMLHFSCSCSSRPTVRNPFIFLNGLKMSRRLTRRPRMGKSCTAAVCQAEKQSEGGCWESPSHPPTCWYWCNSHHAHISAHGWWTLAKNITYTNV